MNHDENSRIFEIVKLFKINRLKPPKELEELTKSAAYASVGCKELSEDAYQTLKKLFAAAFENEGGINFSIKSAIYKGARVWGKLASPDAVSMLNRHKQTIEVAKKKINQRRASKVNIKEVIIKYIDETIEGTNIIAEGTSSMSKDVLQSSKQKLEQLKVVVQRALDINSKTANELAKQIKGADKTGILGYRLSLQNHLLTKTVEEYIDEAIKVAIQWADIVKTPSKRERLKSEEYIQYIEDNFITVLRMKEVKESAERFFTVLDERKKVVEQVSSLQAEINDIRSQNVKIRQEMDAWDVRADNGECSNIEADSQIAMLEDKVRDNSKEIENKNMVLSTVAGYTKIFKSLVNDFGTLKDIYRAYEWLSPTLFYSIFSMIPYNDFILVLEGNATPQQEEKTSIALTASLAEIMKKTAKLDKSQNLVTIGLNDFKNRDKTSQDSESSLANEEQEALERRKKRMAERQQGRASTDATKQDKATSETIIPLNINDN